VAPKITAPVGLSHRGRKFWNDALAAYEPSRADLEVLAETCRTLDNLDALAATITELGPMVTGSQGQQVINPALTEARGQRQILHRLMAALAFADEDEAPIPSARHIRSVTAATARWKGQRKPGPGLGSAG